MPSDMPPVQLPQVFVFDGPPPALKHLTFDERNGKIRECVLARQVPILMLCFFVLVLEEWVGGK